MGQTSLDKRGFARNLTDKQEKFCQLVAHRGSRSQAECYLAAGYSAKTPRHAVVEAAKLLSRPYIFARVAELRDNARVRYELELDGVIQEVARLAFSDIAQFFSTDSGCVRLRPVEEWSKAMSAAVSQIEFWPLDEEGRQSVKRLKLYNKQVSQDQLFKLLGAYAPEKRDVQITQQLEQVAAMSNVDLVREAAKQYGFALVPYAEDAEIVDIESKIS